MKKNINSPYIEGGGICKKFTCEVCGCKFVSKGESKYLYCLQDPMEEIDVINDRKERMRMKKNGI